ncbi:MAG: efflux RND transporter permease subunit [Nitrospinae bacterium]|nr:efflux RND transporter permease subunit [Nitrospinota bacterium]
MFTTRMSVNNPVFVNLVVVVILALGIGLAVTTMNREIFPEFSLDMISVTTTFSNASPEEMEKLITIKLEDEIDDVDGIDTIESESREGISLITLKLQSGVEDVSRVINDVQTAIDNIRNELPREAENPIVQELKSRFPVIVLSIYGKVNPFTLKNIADEVEEEIKRIPGVSRVRVVGVGDREVWVEVDPAALERYGLAIGDIERAIEAKNLNLPGGTLKTARGEYLVRTVGEVTRAEELEQVVLRATQEGNILTVGQVATVRETFEEPTTLGRFNGRPAINLQVSKEKKGDTIAIANAVRQLAQGYERRLPPGVHLGVYNDFSIYIRNRLNTLKQSGYIGLIFVLLVLRLFLATRVAILTALGIPVAFCGALVMMYLYGISINMLSAFSLIIVLGMVVDDAIVVTENIYRHMEEGEEPEKAAVVGTNQVFMPVVASTLTTIAAFIPMLMVPGTMGKFIAVIPLVVSFALLASLVEALIVLPSHMAEFVRLKPSGNPAKSPSDHWFQSVVTVYGRVLERVLRWRYVFITGVLCFSILLVLFARYRIPFTLFTAFESDQFFINMEAPVTYKLEDTSRVARAVETIVQQLPPEELSTIVTNVGMIYLDANKVKTGSHLAQIIVELKKIPPRRRNSDEVINALRDKVAMVPGIKKVQFLSPQAGPGGPAIEINVEGEEFAVLGALAGKVEDYLATIPGVRDIRNTFELGKPELKIYVKPEARALGLTVQAIARQVRDRFRGAESSKIQLSREDVQILVKYPEASRRSRLDVERIKLDAPGGQKVAFSEVAYIVEERGYTQISRIDKRRAITVLADVDKTQGNALEISRFVTARFADLQDRYPGYRLRLKGEQKDFEESVVSLVKAFIVAVLLIYFILGSAFRSFIQPLIIMAAIPFAVDGVIVGHIAMGMNLTFLSLIGTVALAGIVVNDSLVLVDFINNLRRRGLELTEAIVEGGKLRIRAICLTSLTTIAGLSPLAFFASGQARFLMPMALSIVWGLAFSTVLILLVIPCFYAAVDDLKRASRRLVGLNARRRATVTQG